MTKRARKPETNGDGYRDRIVGFKRIPAGELIPNEKNWRTHPTAQQDALKGVLAEIGIANAVIARKVPEGYQLLDGHLRTDVAPNTKWPVLIVDLDDDEAEELLGTLDPLAAMAGANAEKLEALLANIKTGSDDVQALLADLAKEHKLDLFTEPLEDPPAEIDRAAELQKQWATELGQLWDVTGERGGVHRLMCGDSTKAEDVERLMGGETADLVFTSPPYAQQRDYAKKIDDWDGLMQGVFGNIPANDKTQVLVNLGLIHRDGEWIPYWDGWIEWMREQGWRRFGWYVWDQGFGLPGNWNGRLAPSHEFVFHFNRESVQPTKWVDKKQENIGARAAGQSTFRHADGSLEDFTSPGASAQATKIPDTVIRENRQAGGSDIGHPARFSVAFACSVVASWPGTLYDPFLGSGTTLIAAENLGRRCFGMEISPEYVAVALERATKLGCKCTVG